MEDESETDGIKVEKDEKQCEEQETDEDPLMDQGTTEINDLSPSKEPQGDLDFSNTFPTNNNSTADMEGSQVAVQTKKRHKNQQSKKQHKPQNTEQEGELDEADEHSTSSEKSKTKKKKTERHKEKRKERKERKQKRQEHRKERREERVLSQALAGGKRAHITIKEDPDVEREQTALFRNAVLQAVNPNASDQCREDVNAALDAMQRANEEFGKKGKEQDGSFMQYLHSRTPIILDGDQDEKGEEDDTQICIGQCISVKKGVFVRSYQDRLQVMECLAKDYEAKNIALTYCDSVELSPDVSGCTLFVRLKYRSTASFPKEIDLNRHIGFAQELVSQCFPENTQDVAAFTSDPIVKLARENPTEVSPLLCKTMYLVWPKIVLYDIRAFLIFWKTLDMRISASDPFYSNIVDSKVNVARAPNWRMRLRRSGSYRITKCKYCSSQVAADVITSSLHKEFDSSASDCSDNEEHDDDASEMLHQSPSFQQCYHCVKGKVISPYGVIQPYGYVHSISMGKEEANLVDVHSMADMPALEHLAFASITRVRNDFEEYEDVTFNMPEDAPNADDRSHAPGGCPLIAQSDGKPMGIGYGCNSILYAAEARMMKELAKAQYNQAIMPQTRPDIYALCTKVVRSVHPEYEHVVASYITLRMAKKDIIVHVQGRNQRFCFVHGGLHDDKRISFVIRPKAFKVVAQCYEPECKRILGIHAKIMMYNIQTARKKRHGSAAGNANSVDLIPPKERLSEAQMDAIACMTADISILSGWRGPLFEALGMVYMGKKPSEHKFKPREFGPTAGSSSNNLEPCVHDPATGLELPRSLLQAELKEKVKYLNAHRNEIVPEMKSYHSEPGYIPSVKPNKSTVCVYNQIDTSNRGTKEQRMAAYEKIRRSCLKNLE